MIQKSCNSRKAGFLLTPWKVFVNSLRHAIVIRMSFCLEFSITPRNCTSAISSWGRSTAGICSETSGSSLAGGNFAEKASQPRPFPYCGIMPSPKWAFTNWPQAATPRILDRPKPSKRRDLHWRGTDPIILWPEMNGWIFWNSVFWTQVRSSYKPNMCTKIIWKKPLKN